MQPQFRHRLAGGVPGGLQGNHPLLPRPGKAAGLGEPGADRPPARRSRPAAPAGHRRQRGQRVMRAPEDFDVATDALPEEVVKLFPRTAPTGIAHGTVTVLTDAGGVEVTTFRGEGPYLDGRRPSSVTFLGEIEGDLARRDFTVNAIAWDPMEPGLAGLRDPFGGFRDLQRCVPRA